MFLLKEKKTCLVGSKNWFWDNIFAQDLVVAGKL
jgi:hypothetical protein